MPRPDDAMRRRNRMIVAAAKEGVPYTVLAQEYGLTRAMISIICTKAGVRKYPAWTEKERADWSVFRRALLAQRKKQKETGHE